MKHLLIQSGVIRGTQAMVGTPDFARDVLVSIRPFYASKILDGEKTVELRRRFPEGPIVGATAFIYSSSPVKAIIGYARIKHVRKLPVSKIWKEYSAAACISKDAFDTYFAGVKFGFVIFFEGVRALEKQFGIVDLRAQFGIVPPQSYRYVTEKKCLALLSDERFQTARQHKRGHRAGGPSARRGVSF